MFVESNFGANTAEAKQDFPKGYVDQKMYGDQWAFNVSSVILRCERGSAVIVRIGNRDYGLNGTAIQIGYDRLPSDIWKDDRIYKRKISIAPFIEKGRELCK